MDDYKYIFKVVLIGNSGVGKTCMVKRYTQNFFPPGQAATIGVDFMIKTVEINNNNVKLQIWDTAGQERFKAITQSYYRSANVLILVYDISSLESFDSLNHWLAEIDAYAQNDALVYLVGNKSDLTGEREIQTCTGEQFANQHQLKFLETSAKDSSNIDNLFSEIAKELTKKAEEKELKSLPESINPNSTSKVQSSCC